MCIYMYTVHVEWKEQKGMKLESNATLQLNGNRNGTEIEQNDIER